MRMLKSGKQGISQFNLSILFSVLFVFLLLDNIWVECVDTCPLICRRLKIPIVIEDYIGECVQKSRMLPFDLYKVESIFESSKGGTVTVKVKGRSAVHESSGLQDTAHILEDGKSIYNTTLNMSDLARGVNRQGISPKVFSSMTRISVFGWYCLKPYYC
jgi:hypothetical protein